MGKCNSSLAWTRFHYHVTGYLYDTVLLWAFAVNETLVEGGAPNDGEKVINKTFNYTFQGVTDTVFIDYKGDRRIDNRLSIVQPGPQVSG